MIAEKKSRTLQETAQKTTISIVVADDNPDLRELLCLRLDSVADFEIVAQAEDGVQALELCLQHRPDAVFFDIDMPTKSGLATAAELKQAGLEPFLVFVTGQAEHALKAFEVNADAYLLKPITKAQLEECTDRLRTQVKAKRQSSRVDQLEAKVEELEHESNTDPLVGAHNRRYMDRRLKIEYERARRYDRALSCIMLDLDKFKDVNDSHGHTMGDKVLVQLCEVIGSAMRIEDSLARYVGEEFVVLLVEAGADAACRTAERIRTLIEGHVFGDESTRLKLTMSLGIAVLKEDESATEMTERADKALYLAKNEGRNRWVLAE